MQPAGGASGCFSAAPKVVWGGLCNRVSCRASGFPFCMETGGPAFTEDACANPEMVAETTSFPKTPCPASEFSNLQNLRREGFKLLLAVCLSSAFICPKYIRKYLCQPIFVLLYSLKRGSVYIDANIIKLLNTLNFVKFNDISFTWVIDVEQIHF